MTIRFRTKTFLTLAAVIVATQAVAATVNAALITGTTVESSYAAFNASRPPSDAIDGNGLPGGNPALSGTHNSAGWGGNFLVIDGSTSGVWITVDLEGNYSIDQIHVWNYGESGVTNRGMKNVEIYVAPDENEANLVKLITDGTDATHNVSGDFLLPIADDASWKGVDLGLTGVTNASLLDNVRLVKIINLDNHGSSNRVGLAEIQFGGGDPVIDLLVPEPASIAIWSILGLCLAGYGYRRRRNG